MLNQKKVRVTKLFGASHPVGVMDPKVGMQVRQRAGQTLFVKQIHTSGTYQVGLSLTSNGPEVRREYPWKLFVDYGHATGTWSYPSGDGSHEFGHSQGMFDGGAPVMNSSGVVYAGGDNATHTYGR